MRTLIPALALLTLAACGGTKTKVGGPTEAPPGTERPPGTTGMPGLDWDATVSDIQANYPGAEPNGGGLAWNGVVDGRDARVQFVMDGDGLRTIEINWGSDFASMGECGVVLDDMKPAVDKRLGPGPVENLGAFWETATASVTIACNPNDDESASLQGTYAQKTE